MQSINRNDYFLNPLNNDLISVFPDFQSGSFKENSYCSPTRRKVIIKKASTKNIAKQDKNQIYGVQERGFGHCPL